MESYEINSDTLAIIPKNENESIVYESDNKYVVKESVDKIMEDSCLYFGSNFEGRKASSARILNLTHKLPILVEESNSIIFFPTASPRLASCSWISLNNIDHYEKHNEGSKLVFKDGQIVVLPISYGMLDNQVLRSSRLQYLLTTRKGEKMGKKSKK
jgi:competence protein ComK